MEQLTQNLKDGKMQILEVPFPGLEKGQVLVRNHFSVISAGTEGKTVKDARMGYIGKAMARREEVKKVVRSIKTIGLTETYRITMNKLDAPSPLGYSCAGEVIGVADDVRDFKVGDLVACGGNTAVHAEVVAVPVNLCVKVNHLKNIHQAAFATLGAIALQGVRQADLRLGENCVVIGLGVIGQMTLMLLEAAGVKAIGIDIDERMVQAALNNGSQHAYNRNMDGLEEAILNHTNSYGTDAVIITASTDSPDPVDLAGAISRKKGKVVIVGAVPTGFKRQNYFKKELDLRMSSSYGPGRYDREYEDQGIDYPYAYVRWTENRNMQAIVDLIEAGKLDLSKLITHEFSFSEAQKAYDMILKREESFVGITLRYPIEKSVKNKIDLPVNSVKKNSVAVGLIGAGAFADNVLLPALKGLCNFTGVATARANNSRNIADKYGFAYCTSNPSDIIMDKAVDVVVIATRHHTHAQYTLEALRQNKHVFTEKPLCLNDVELNEIKEAQQSSKGILMVGFNRRFSPQVQDLAKRIKKSGLPVAINYRINAGQSPADHWIHDPAVGGGRIIGEVCHFIDTVAFLAGSEITSVSANALRNASNLLDTLTISLAMANGSVASISYFSNGNKQLSKEFIEVFSGGNVDQIDDFKRTISYGSSKKETELGKQDKGHKQEVREFITALKEGKPSPIPFNEIYNVMYFTFRVQDSILAGGQKLS